MIGRPEPAGEVDRRRSATSDDERLSPERAPATPDGLARAIRSLTNDAAGARAVAALERAGIPVILLKGPAIANWLYSGSGERPYGDVDLLISPTNWTPALLVLKQLGYQAPRETADDVERSTSELDLVGPHAVRIDLHHRLAGSTSEPASRCFDELLQHSTTMVVANQSVRVLDQPARAMHLALHAAQNGPLMAKSHEDLRRGLVALDIETWREAAAIADRIGADVPFAVGLRTHPAGLEVADELGLPNETNTELVLRQEGAPAQALAFVAFSELRGPARLRFVWRKLVPTSALLAHRYDLGFDRPADWVRGYFWHWRHVVYLAGPSVTAYWRASRRTSPEASPMTEPSQQVGSPGRTGASATRSGHCGT